MIKTFKFIYLQLFTFLKLILFPLIFKIEKVDFILIALICFNSYRYDFLSCNAEVLQTVFGSAQVL